MKRITGERFIEEITKDPSWCKNLKEPLEIITFIDIPKSPITHLSPLLTFSGKNNIGWVANFTKCEKLEVATGTFNGAVCFYKAGIKEIKNLLVTKTTNYGQSANFDGCKELTTATGTFEGIVYFGRSGVTTIKNLIVKTSAHGIKAESTECPIKYIPEEYRGEEYLFDDGTIENSILRDKTIEKIKSEANNIEL